MSFFFKKVTILLVPWFAIYSLQIYAAGGLHLSLSRMGSELWSRPRVWCLLRRHCFKTKHTKNIDMRAFCNQKHPSVCRTFDYTVHNGRLSMGQRIQKFSEYNYRWRFQTLQICTDSNSDQKTKTVVSFVQNLQTRRQHFKLFAAFCFYIYIFWLLQHENKAVFEAQNVF